MREIYIIKLDDDIPLPSESVSVLKEAIYLLMDEISRYNWDILSFEEDNLIYNYLLETYSYNTGKYTFRMLSDRNNDDFRRYDPFILNDTTFGFTTYKDSLTEEKIASEFNRIMRNLNINCQYTISKIILNKKERMQVLDKTNKAINDRNRKKKVKTRSKVFKNLWNFQR